MGRKFGLLAFVAITVFAGYALAGSSSSPPGGGEGGGSPEPEVFALILFSLLPGIFFARRALAARVEVEEAQG